ncbi:MAG: amidohydrolase family protein [Kiritimatiellaeota bacterium]|nr:amidohydrolase family protein [Kiritimatiellota bacterium]
MIDKHLKRWDLVGKTIDCHSHVGVALKMYGLVEYPYAETAEGIYYKQISAGVDINVVFPYTFDLYCDWKSMMKGDVAPAADPISEFPYKVENRTLMREVFDYQPRISRRFIPFVSVDPGRDVPGQLAELEKLEREYPIYGIKINPVACRTRSLELLDAGKDFLDFAAERDIPFLFHSMTIPNDIYSQASDIFKIVEERSDLRFCFAHAMLFNKHFLELAAKTPNAWVDTAALKIQVDLMNQLVAEGVVERSSLIDTDYTDHKEVMKTLCETCPDTLLWGTDSPAYSFHCRRAQGDGMVQDFSLTGAYEDEVAALKSVDREIRGRVSNANTLDFIFGKAIGEVFEFLSS